MLPRLHIAVLVRPTSVILTMLVTVAGLALFLFITVALVMTWIMAFVLANPLLVIGMVGGIAVFVAGCAWLVRAVARWLTA